MMRHFEQMQHEGGCIGSYSGDGSVTLVNGSVWECKFELEHHVELGVLIECRFEGSKLPWIGKFNSFEGTTSDGLFSIKTIGDGQIRSSFTRSDSEKEISFCVFLIGVDGALVRRIFEEQPSEMRYGITNFRFTGTQSKGDMGLAVLPLELDNGTSNVKINLEYKSNYKNVCRYIESYRSVRVTCEAVVDATKTRSPDATDSVIDDLCQLMSVARGTRVVWVYRQSFDAVGRVCETIHSSVWVGKYSCLSLFDDGALHREDVKRFLEVAYPIYREKNEAFELSKNLLESYLAAKVGVDLLERRGVKLVVSLELLKNLYLKSTNSLGFIVEKSRFTRTVKKLKPAIKEIMEQHEYSKDEIKESMEKINELNRTSFGKMVRAAFGAVGYAPSDTELKLFLRQRNSLVHTGCFDEINEEERRLVYFSEQGSTDEEPESESEWNVATYFFMINFMDKFFLKFFRYLGPYLNQKMKLPCGRIANYDNFAE